MLSSTSNELTDRADLCEFRKKPTSALSVVSTDVRKYRDWVTVPVSTRDWPERLKLSRAYVDPIVAAVSTDDMASRPIDEVIVKRRTQIALSLGAA